MSPQYHPYRIVYTVAGHKYDWTRYASTRERAESLARRALQHDAGARLVSVERTRADR
jgi:hypothetical protein